MKFAWVTTNLLDLWAEPKFDSERSSQLLFAELLKVGVTRNRFCKVTQIDGHNGWADGRFLAPILRTEFYAYRKKINATVSVSSARIVESATGRTVPPHVIYYGTRLICRHSSDGKSVAILPDGSRLFLKAGSVRPIKRQMSMVADGRKLVAEARRFLGVPYLWGGVSPNGFDCSGFVRAVCARFNICLPRDTKDQILVGHKVARDCIKRGDLVFFDRHVGLAIDGATIIHSSLGGGGVRINSISPDREDYRNDLDENFRTARRVL